MKSTYAKKPVIVALLAFVSTASCTCTSGEEPQGHAGATSDAAQDPAGSGGGSSDAEDAKDAPGEVEASPCSATPASSAIPTGWVRFPGLPCKCDIWVAPSADQMGPPPSWITRPSGVLELENNWADYAHRILSASSLGDSYRGEQLIAFGRDLGEVDGTFVHEWIVLRMPANELLFRGRQPGGDSGTCYLRTEALGQGNALYVAWESVYGSAPTNWALAGGHARVGSPELIYSETAGNPASRYVVAQRLIAGLRDGAEAISVIPLGVPAATPKRIGSANAGRSLELLGAWNSTLFFMEYGSDLRGEIWAWDEARGLRRFLARTGDGPDQVGSVCGLGTDGEVLVWTQYSGWNGASWERIDVMKAPFTTDETALKPVRVRAALGGNGSCRNWKVGGGHAASKQRLGQLASDPEQVTVVRLSDGRAWTIADRSGWRYGVPLYVTAEETAMEEDQTDPNDAGVTAYESWTIVRYPLSLLGPGVPASEPK